MEIVAWLVFIFVVPSNLFLKLCASCGYVHGVLSDYLIPKLFLVDIIMVGILLGTAWRWLSLDKLIAHLRSWWFVWLCWLGIGLLQTQSVLPLLSLWLWLKLTGFGLLAGLFASQLSTGVFSTKSGSHLMRTVLSGTLIFQSSLGLWQWLTQRSLAGYWLLGEPDLTTPFGLARAQFPWGEMILPYGTTPHPNVLAGFLTLGLLALTYWYIRTPQTMWQKTYSTVTALLALTVIHLSQSASAQLTLIIGGILLLVEHSLDKSRFNKIPRHFALPLLVCIWLVLAGITYRVGRHQQTELSIYRRAYLIEASGHLFQAHPLTGTGLGTFTAVSETALPRQEVVRFNQPVHHGFLLLLVELGAGGTLLLLILAGTVITFHKQSSSGALIAVLTLLTPLIVWDHYLVSLETGHLLGLFTLVFFFNLERHP
jgi:O-antigen ligase